MTGRFTLGKSERLKSRKAIDKLFLEGKKINASGIRSHFLVNENSQGLKLGVGVSSKNFKRAVDRNRIKRLIREAYRLQKQALQEKFKNKSLEVFFIYTGKELPKYDDIFNSVRSILTKIEKSI